MINYKQILEAINRGIRFALDDFDDNDELQGQVNSKVNYQHGTKEYLDLINEVVDLDLPSGTLWCKYNLGVDSNQLTSPENWYGDYYAWGEMTANKTNNGEIYFGQDNYKFGKEYNKLTKYCSRSDYGLNHFRDILIQLLPEDDVAYQNKKLYNYKFHIPTKEQLKELLKYTQNYWVRNYDPNKIKHNPEDDKGIQGLNGYVFEGKNGNQLFIPAAGFYKCSDGGGDGSGCCLWSSSLVLGSPCDAYYLSFNSDNNGIYSCGRYYGFSIRPVLNL